METPKEIFKAYDIRGIVGKTFTQEIVEDFLRGFRNTLPDW